MPQAALTYAEARDGNRSARACMCGVWAVSPYPGSPVRVSSRCRQGGLLKTGHGSGLVRQDVRRVVTTAKGRPESTSSDDSAAASDPGPPAPSTGTPCASSPPHTRTHCDKHMGNDTPEPPIVGPWRSSKLRGAGQIVCMNVLAMRMRGVAGPQVSMGRT